MKNDLIERYIYAAVRRLPKKNREDVSRELETLIEDMLLERCGDAEPTEKDIRVVLTELGDPRDFYQKNDESGKKCLIGQPHFSMYQYVLKIVLACTAFGITISRAILQIQQPQPGYEAIGQWIEMLFQSVMGTFGAVTLLFAVLYHMDVRITEPFNFDNLPAVPKKNEEISYCSCVVGIVISVVFLVIFLAMPDAISIVVEDGQRICMFNGDVLRNSWLILATFAMVTIIQEIVKLLERRYNTMVLVVTLGSNLISGVLAMFWLTRQEVFNPAFLEKMVVLTEGKEVIFSTLFEKFQVVILAVFLLALILDTVDTAVKSLRK